MPGGPLGAAIGPALSSAVFSVGARVEGRYMATTLGPFGTKWYPATVQRVHADGSCDLHYDDSEDESHVAVRFVREPKAKTRPPPPLAYDPISSAAADKMRSKCKIAPSAPPRPSKAVLPPPSPPGWAVV